MNKMKYLLWVALVASVCLICGCPGDDDDPPTAPTTINIGPSGGTIPLGVTGALVIPAGALSTTIGFTVTEVTSPTAIGGDTAFVSNVYEVQPCATDFASPGAFLTLGYFNIPIGNGEEDDILIYHDDGSGWESVSTTVVSSANTVTGTVDGACRFGAAVDTTGGGVTTGTFAALVVARAIVEISGTLFTIDQLVARFDDEYAPCTPVAPCSAVAVVCGGYSLPWDASVDAHVYRQGMTPFLTPGTNYTFAVTGNTCVPAFVADIEFPTENPYVTNLEQGATVSRSGFEVQWTGTGSGDVQLVFMGAEDTDTLGINVMVPNDGSYTFSSAGLSAITSDTCALVLVKQNTETINAAGLDSRSYIWGRSLNTTELILQ